MQAVSGGDECLSAEVTRFNQVKNQVLKCNCMMKCYNKSSVQSLDSDIDSQYPTSVDVESAPTRRPQLDSELHLQHSTSVLTRQVSLTYPNLILNLIVTSYFSDGTRHTRHTPNLIPNLIATRNFSDKNQTYLIYPNLIPNLIATRNFSEKSVTGTRHTRHTPNLILNLIATSNFSAGRSPPISIGQTRNLYILINKKLFYRTTNITFASV